MRKVLFYHEFMKPFTSTWTAIALALTVFLSGCGGEPKEKVDVQAQIRNLSSSDAETRVNACVELAKAGPDAAPAIQPLIAALKDTDPLVRRLAAYALGEMGPAAKDAVPALKALMSDPDRDASAAAVNSLALIDPKAAPSRTLPNVSN